jgi:hypothetical protein
MVTLSVTCHQLRLKCRHLVCTSVLSPYEMLLPLSPPYLTDEETEACVHRHTAQQQQSQQQS